MKRYFKTQKRLAIAIENKHRIEGMSDYLDRLFIGNEFDIYEKEMIENCLDGDLMPVPYYFLEGCIDYALSPLFRGINDEYAYNHSQDDPDYIRRRDYKPEDLMTQYVKGMDDRYEYGDRKVFDGQDYEYLVSIPLSQEIEHHTEDDEQVIESRGYSFARIWMKV